MVKHLLKSIVGSGMSDTLALINVLAHRSSQYTLNFDDMGPAELQRLNETLSTLLAQGEATRLMPARTLAQVLPFPPKR